jgi:ABC-type transport system involved in multi-copper enzyme maturation permease subunit
MKAIWAIARLTVKEAVRNKILYLLFCFALFLIVFSWIIGKLTVGDEVKIIRDLGLSSIHFFGILITVIIGIGLVFKEMEKRTIYLVLSKPIPRYQFLLGKFIGLAVTLFVILICLGGLFGIILMLKGDHETRIVLAFIGIYQEWLLVAAIAMMFSSFSTPLLSVMLSLSTFFMGHLSRSLLMLRDRLNESSSNFILTAIYHLLPDLEFFNIRAQVVHNLALPQNYFLNSTAYWIVYMAAILLFSISIFQKKDFV